MRDDPRPGFWETSEYMIGKVGVYIVFVESTGEIDPNLETWDELRMTEVELEIYLALHWWMKQYPFIAPPLEFYVNARRLVGYTRYEPISRPWTDEKLWVPEVLSSIGCGSSTNNYYVMAKECANKIREQWNTDWAFIIFVIDSYNDPDGMFADNNRFAYAFLNGPYMVVTYDNNGWGIGRMDRVVAHEIGHIFGATDEYDGKQERGGYLYEWDVEGSGCIMDTAEWCISSGTRRQIGWIDENNNRYPDLVENKLVIEIYKSPNPVTDADSFVYEGVLRLEPYPCRRPDCRSVTINKISNGMVIINSSSNSMTLHVMPRDGRFDSALEEFTFMFSPTRAQKYFVNIIATDVFGLSHATYSHSFLYTFQKVIEGNLTPLRQRIDVGSPVRAAFKLVWAHDGSPVESADVWIGGARARGVGDGWYEVVVVRDSPGKVVFKVENAAAWHLGYIIRRLESYITPIEIIWDKVTLRLDSLKTRVDVGSSAPITVRAYYAYDSSPASVGIRFNLPLIQNEVGRYVYKVVAVDDPLYGLTAFESNEVAIIFDRVVLNVIASKQRVDVGNEAPIIVKGHYEYDGTPFVGTVYLNNAIRQQTVGKYNYYVIGISDRLYGLTVFRSNQIEVIFDRVVVRLTPLLNRVQVGREAKLSYTAYYEYDGRPFRGEVFLDKPLVSHVMGPVTYGVSGINDTEFGLKSYRFEEVTVIFDLIKAELNIDQMPFGIKPIVRLVYQYDGSPVRGATVYLGRSPLLEGSDKPGTYSASFTTLLPYISGTLNVVADGFDPITINYSQIQVWNALTYTALVGAVLMIYFRRRSKPRQ